MAPRPRFLGQRRPRAPAPPPARGGLAGRRTRGPACEREGNVCGEVQRRPEHRQSRPAEKPLPTRPGTPRRALPAGLSRSKTGGGAGGAAGHPLQTTTPSSEVTGTGGKPRQARLPRALQRSRVPATATGRRSLPVALTVGKEKRKKKTRGATPRPRHRRGSEHGESLPPGHLRSAAGHRDRRPLIFPRSAGSRLGPEKKDGAPPPPRPPRADFLVEPSGDGGSRGRPDATGRPRMARAGKKEAEAPPPRPRHHRALLPGGGRGKPRQARNPPAVCVRPAAGHHDRPPLSARLAGSGLRPEKNKGRGAATSPAPIPWPSGAGGGRRGGLGSRRHLCLGASTSTRHRHHRALGGTGESRAELRCAPPALPAFECRRRPPPPVFALRPAPREPNRPGEPPLRPPSAPLGRPRRGRCSRWLAPLSEASPHSLL